MIEVSAVCDDSTFVFNVYLASLGLCCSMRDICCVVWDLLLQAGTLVVTCRLCSMGFVVLWHMGS